MKKRGFTLVELLAVIAILAILVIIALPNVMNLFNRAKEQAFETELKEIFKTAQQQWIADSMFNTQERTYAKCSSENCAYQLEMSGRSELEYSISIDKSGNVISFQATDGSYQYNYSGTGLKIEEISDIEQISKLDDEGDIISITCEESASSGPYTGMIYVFGESSFRVGDSIESWTKASNISYDSWPQSPTYVTKRNKITTDFYHKANVENNIITSASLCLYGDREYCVKGGTNVDAETIDSMRNYILGKSGSCGTGYCTYDYIRFDYNQTAFNIQQSTALFCGVSDNNFGCSHD